MQVQLPDGTVGEFPDDMQQADIEAVLQKHFEQPAALPDAAKSFVSQVGRNIPEGLDLGGAAVASGINAVTGGDGDYWNGFMQPRQTPMTDLTNTVVGDKYQPQTTAGKVSQFAGGFVGPTDWLV